MPSACGTLGISLNDVNCLVTTSSGTERWLSDQVINVLSWSIPSGLPLTSSGVYSRHTNRHQTFQFGIPTNGKCWMVQGLRVWEADKSYNIHIWHSYPYIRGALSRLSSPWHHMLICRGNHWCLGLCATVQGEYVSLPLAIVNDANRLIMVVLDSLKQDGFTISQGSINNLKNRFGSVQCLYVKVWCPLGTSH